jgi:hypothetical protein
VNKLTGIRTGYAALAAALVALVLYAASIGNGLAYDDDSIIGLDPRVQSLSHVRAIFTEGYWSGEADLALYRPLTTLSFALDWSLGGGKAEWFHFSNVLWNAAACALVVLLLARFFRPNEALAGGVLFAVHPVHVEAVANVVGRAELMAACFFLGACILWLQLDARGPWRLQRALAVAVFYALALLSKEGAVMLPAILLLIDTIRGELRLRAVPAYVRAHWPAFLMFTAVVAGFIGVRTAVLGGVAPVRVDAVFDMARHPLLRVLTALQAWSEYARLFFFPRTLLADYGPRVLLPAETLAANSAAGLLILLAVLGGGIIALLRGWQRTALALLWFVITIFPVSNLIVPIGVIVAERTLYLPSVTLAIGAAGLLAYAPRAPRTLSALRVAGAVVLVLLAGRSLARIPEWDSTDRILVALVRERPDSFRGQWYLARRARMENDTSGAITRYTRALELWPWRKRLVMEAATFAVDARRLALAGQIATHAVSAWPDDVDALRLRAGIAMDLGDTATARASVRNGLRVAPNDGVLLRMRAALGDTTEARP